MQLNEQLNQIGQSLAGIVPELFLAIFFLGYLVAELLVNRTPDKEKSASWLFFISLGGAIIALGLIAGQWDTPPDFRFRPLLFLDNKAVFFKILVVTAWLFTLLHIRLLRYRFPPELNGLLIAAVLGMCLLSMATHWLTVYLALELLSLSSYLLVALSPAKKAAEGALKYLLFGAISSAIMLYGISFLYGLTGTLDFTNPAMQLGLAANTPLVMNVAMLMTLGGLLFKLSLVPFHVWTPDVYEAAPTPLVSFLSVAPKAAVLLVLMRVATAFPAELLPLLGGIALVSITVGNVAALWQQNARRLLAYSSIAQAGYLIVGVVAFNQLGFEGATFYVAAYLLLNMTAFLLVDLLLPRSDTPLADYKGLGKQHALVATGLTVVMVALAGLPPTVGFTAKWLVFSALWDSYQQQEQPWLMWLLIGGIVNAAISLAYYLRLPYLLFFKNATNQPLPAIYSSGGKIISGILLAAILVLFFKPEWLMGLIQVI
ncbi:NADH-quinone oxidoreductase subunit N [Persicitalea jodogahamensis]|uniref:NADH-quinone oxidoreductase subunit N n=1 Tax=Persicitalea jodogahamensis TaxID=402147 RepID=A0A8J3D0S6_9BACT|nr:NADH-quinone oxidoreductase subunit N [Persicitalea jodogahamensis]GHB51826.1 NADH-quinone oxidoreductase subunit N [Persicitalea jodogahamensis]